MFECENEFSLVKFLAGSKGCAENLLVECHILVSVGVVMDYFFCCCFCFVCLFVCFGHKSVQVFSA